ncbi:CocE/NonD family hydrolase C-terminal non-catalytic domain-containing protein [Burkholderia cepacia]|nr:CocE/NonD family hydrolase C-terminal non-catalytic domain-containing protein [Burkholderia cepacia]MDO5948320.1 CocE/NonD family hydrolase C-terminal non-catalytic domain-containing protein [Burkholderia cepacia]
MEDLPAMIERYPLMNGYWESKRANVESISIPAYITASWTNFIHTFGTFDGWTRLGSEKKWLRVHNTHEWPDYYRNEDDLRRFFDRYLHGVSNDWEQTPKVRFSLLDPGGSDAVDLPADDYPLPGTKYRRLYLDTDTNVLVEGPPARGSLRYRSDDSTSKVQFNYRFTKETKLVGPISLTLSVSADEAEDIDLFAKVQKLNFRRRVQWLRTVPFRGFFARTMTALLRISGKRERSFIFFDGMHGRFRVSHREDVSARAPGQIQLRSHSQSKLLAHGEVATVTIPLTPIGMKFRAGEELCLTIAGHNMNSWPMSDIPTTRTINRGGTVIHSSEEFQSFLEIPEV